MIGIALLTGFVTAFGCWPIEATRAKVRAVPRLLNHPKVAPGRTREEFFALLEDEGLVVE